MLSKDVLGHSEESGERSMSLDGVHKVWKRAKDRYPSCCGPNGRELALPFGIFDI